MMVTVGFDATAAVRQAAGIGRYTRELLGALAQQHNSNRYRVFYCGGGHLAGALPSLDGRFKVRALPLTDRVTNALWHRLQLPIPVQWAVGAFDIFHSPDFTLPPVQGRPAIVTVHDLAFLTVPECAYPTLRDYLTRVVPRSIRRANRIIAVSESTRRDIVNFVGVPEERVTTVYEAADMCFAPMEPEAARLQAAHLDVPRPFVLSVGTIEPRKNYVRLLHAFGRMRTRGSNHHLVIAGRRGWMDEPVFRAIEELALSEFVHVVQPTDPELVGLYNAADAFVYPSLYEGFGIPPLEALACGTPTACSRVSSLPEVVGEAALLFDPESVEEIQLCMERLLGDAALVAHMRRAGPRHAAQFSWQRAAHETSQLYDALAADA